MTPVTIVVAAVAVICLILFCPMSAEPDSIHKVQQEATDRGKEWIELYIKRDFKKLCNELYTEDCVVYLPDATKAVGREECALGWEAIEENDYQYTTFDPVVMHEFIVTGADYAIETGYANDNVNQHVKFVVVWKRVGGKLYVFHNINNANTPYKPPTLLEKITYRRNEWSYYYRNGDFESACNVYTPDCWIAPPGAPPVFGRDGCERLSVKLVLSGAASFSKSTGENEVYELGDGFVLNYWAWIIHDAAGNERDRGKDVLIWKRLDDGQYYMHFDMWNSDIHF